VATAFPAARVAIPVLERLHGGARAGAVLGVGATAAWVELDGFVVAVTTREVPLLPNAVALAAGSGTLAPAGVAAGHPAHLTPGRLDLGPLRVTWDPSHPPTWDPTVPVPETPAPGAVADRGAALLLALGVRPHPSVEAAADPGAVDSREHPTPPPATFPLRGAQQPGGVWTAARDHQQPGGAWTAARDHQQPGGASPATQEAWPSGGTWPAAGITDPGTLVRELARIGLATARDPEGARGLEALFRAVRECDPTLAAEAADLLVGRGPGLTPEGDDLVAAVTGALAVLGPVTGVEATTLAALLGALGPGPGRTTGLSATLLELAARRRLIEPAGSLLDLAPAGEAAWPAALRRLERLGHGSGRAYAVGIAATASVLAAGRPAR
jgi:hypothetical protein